MIQCRRVYERAFWDTRARDCKEWYDAEARLVHKIEHNIRQ